MKLFFLAGYLPAARRSLSGQLDALRYKAIFQNGVWDVSRRNPLFYGDGRRGTRCLSHGEAMRDDIEHGVGGGI